MIWRAQKPTQAGWYWYRKDQRQSQVLMQVKGSGAQTTAGWPDGRWDAVFSMPGEWSGPLERPVPQ
jgi:hypothetical protein